MAVISVNEIYNGRKASDQQEHNARQYTRVFRVIFDTLFEGPAQALAAIPVRLYEPYITPTEVDFGAKCKTRTASNAEPFVYEVTCDYDSTPEDQEENEQDPLDRAVKISISFSSYQKPAVKDLDGKAVANTCDPPESFDPPVMIDDLRAQIQLEKNFDVFDLGLARQYANAINSDSYLGFAPKTLKIVGFSATEEKENDQTYWKVTCQMQAAEEGKTWELEVLNQGFFEMIGGVRKLATENPADGTGTPVSAPVLLAEGGTRLAAGATPHFIKFRVYAEQPFASLNFF